MRTWSIVGALVLVVIAAVLVGPQLFGPSSAQVDADVTDFMTSWRGSVRLYTATHRKLPTSTEELLAWAKDHDGLPYKQQDPWGNLPDVRAIDLRSGVFEIRSLGEDGVFGTDDDLIYSSADDKTMTARKRRGGEVVR